MSDPMRQAYWALRRCFSLKKPKMEPKEIFSDVYRQRVWGAVDDFDSGTGSRDESVVRPYVAAVTDFLSKLHEPARVVDIGCGDFNVGQHLVPHTAKYIGCDIVEELIDRNRRRFIAPNLSFEVVNAIDGALPGGNVVIIRQVLQHLSNEHIAVILEKLTAFPYWIITEHLPGDSSFTPNVNKPTGGDIRVRKLNSGVVLTSPPFSVQPKSEQVICEVPSPSADKHAVIRTTAYCF